MKKIILCIVSGLAGVMLCLSCVAQTANGGKNLETAATSPLDKYLLPYQHYYDEGTALGSKWNYLDNEREKTVLQEDGNVFYHIVLSPELPTTPSYARTAYRQGIDKATANGFPWTETNINVVDSFYNQGKYEGKKWKDAYDDPRHMGDAKSYETEIEKYYNEMAQKIDGCTDKDKDEYRRGVNEGAEALFPWEN